MFTHIDDNNNPQMVDVSEKAVTKRTAIARGIMQVDAKILEQFDGQEIKSPKGAVFQTAMIAMTMAAKKTHESICFCHPIAVEDVKTNLYIQGGYIFVEASVSLHAKTGVEMEALHAVSIGLLNIYDMCKAISSEMTIKELKLIKKMGGEKDYTTSEDIPKDIAGLILIGGRSRRMGQDKFNMDMGRGKQIEYLHALLSKQFKDVYISCNADQVEKYAWLKDYNLITDIFSNQGPLGGIASAFQQKDNAFFVVACDLPNITESTVSNLVTLREKKGRQHSATLYFNETRKKLEPLCGIYEAKMKFFVWEALKEQRLCATALVESMNVNHIPLVNDELRNVNSKDDLNG